MESLVTGGAGVFAVLVAVLWLAALALFWPEDE